MQRDTSSVVTEAIDHVEPEGIVTADGRLHELDVIVLATGFDAHAYMRPMEIVGEGGRDARGGMGRRSRALPHRRAARLPELLHADGPAQPDRQLLADRGRRDAGALRHAAGSGALRERERQAHRPDAEATARFNDELRGAMPGTVWVTGCTSWYIGADGTAEAVAVDAERHREMLRAAALEEFEISGS